MQNLNKKEYLKQRKQIVKLKWKKLLINQEHREINQQLWTIQHRIILQLKICELKPNPEYKKNNEDYYSRKWEHKAYTLYKENYETEDKEKAEQMKTQLEKTYTNYKIIIKEIRIRIPSMPKTRYNTIAEITKQILTNNNEKNNDWEYIRSDGENE